jgi:hypothetical protein
MQRAWRWFIAAAVLVLAAASVEAVVTGDDLIVILGLITLTAFAAVQVWRDPPAFR